MDKESLRSPLASPDSPPRGFLPFHIRSRGGGCRPEPYLKLVWTTASQGGPRVPAKGCGYLGVQYLPIQGGGPLPGGLLEEAALIFIIHQSLRGEWRLGELQARDLGSLWARPLCSPSSSLRPWKLALGQVEDSTWVGRTGLQLPETAPQLRILFQSWRRVPCEGRGCGGWGRGSGRTPRV